MTHELTKITGSAKNKKHEVIDINDLIENVYFLCKNSLIRDEISFLRESDLSGIKITSHRSSMAQVLLDIIHLFKENLKGKKDRFINISFEGLEDSIHIIMSAPFVNSCSDILNALECPFSDDSCFDKGVSMELNMTKNILKEHGGNLFARIANGHTEIVLSLPLANSQKKSA